MGNKKTRTVVILSIALFLLFGFFTSLFLSSYVVIAQDQTVKANEKQENSEKQSGNNKESSVIKIPPPIEGLSPYEDQKPQSLKTTEIAILSANGKLHKYTVEIASTPEQLRKGMMFRTNIKENTGMLFVFKEEAERTFWMKNTYIPLDILFIRADGVINHIHHMAQERSLKPIRSNGKAIAVLEIAGGEAEILGINIGDRILYKDF